MSHGAYDVLRCKLHAAVHSRRMAALWCTARACPTQLILHVRAACHADVVHVLHMLLHLPRAASCTLPVVCCVSRVARHSAVWCRGRILHGVRCMRSLWASPPCSNVQSINSGPIRSGVAAVRSCSCAQKQSGSARAAAANQRRTDWHYSTRRTLVLAWLGDGRPPAATGEVHGRHRCWSRCRAIRVRTCHGLSVVCSRCLSVCATGGHARPDG
jgi:hypothetical protein